MDNELLLEQEHWETFPDYCPVLTDYANKHGGGDEECHT